MQVWKRRSVVLAVCGALAGSISACGDGAADPKDTSQEIDASDPDTKGDTGGDAGGDTQDDADPDTVTPDVEGDGDAQGDGDGDAQGDGDGDAQGDGDGDATQLPDDGPEVTPDVPDVPDVPDEGPEVTPDVPDVPDVVTGTPPAAGDLVFTELMINPAVVSDLVGEWVELHNTTAEALDLSGCVLHDDGSESFTFGAGEAVIPAGAYWVLAPSGDAAKNDGVTVDVVVPGLKLSNSADAVALTCDGVEIDRVAYDVADGFPVKTGFSSALDPSTPPSATTNDEVASWCSGASAYGAHNHGSPGAANPPCPVDGGLVTACVLAAPIDLKALEGTPVAVLGQVYQPGVTDASPFLDPFPGLVAQAGWGPDGTDPLEDGDAWTWTNADGTQGWVDSAAPAGYDQYQVTLAAPQPGTWAFAFRFSRDGGDSWVLCDTSGSDDGYQLVDAGRLTSVADPCAPNPCTDAPAPLCVNGTTLRTYPATGVCKVGADFAASCSYPHQDVPCDLTLGTCQLGACVGGAVPPGPGEVVFNEIMMSPLGVANLNGQWLELASTAEAPVDLTGCVLADGFGGSVAVGTPAEPVLLVAGGYAVLAGGDEALGGKAPAATWGSELALGQGSTLTLTCGGVEIDAVTLDIDFLSATYGDPPLGKAGIALQLGSGALDAAANDDGTQWCHAKTTFPTGDLGTPGADNRHCPSPEPVDLCRLAPPLEQVAEAGAKVTVVGQLVEAGMTDVSAGNDPGVLVEVGFGPVGSDPSQDADGWTLFAADPIEGWTESEPGLDAWEGSFAAPSPGEYAYAARVSVDEGLTWTWCDAPGEAEGADGSEDGFQPALAGALTSIVPLVCDPNPCTTPPAPGCKGDTQVTYTGPGACSASGGEAVCAWGEILVDCTATGAVCVAGECLTDVGKPGPGDLVITEIMKDPNELDDAHAEWFEVLNVSDLALDLEGCVLKDKGTDKHTIATGSKLIAGPGELLLFVRKSSLGINGGLTPDYVFGDEGDPLTLGNGSDELIIECGGQVIDQVAWTISFLTNAGKRPAIGGSGFAMSLDPTAYDATANDAGVSWCNAVDSYHPSNTGTPGTPNPSCFGEPEPDPCDPNPCDAPPEDTCDVDGVTLVTYSSKGTCEADGGSFGCTYAKTSVDCAADGKICESGSCVAPPVDPCEPNPCPAPPEATCDADGVTLWVYGPAACTDVDGEASCAYGPTEVDCAGLGEVCQDGACVAPPVDPCDPNPCTEPPAAACEPDGVTLTTYAAVGACAADGETASCDYGPAQVDCGATDQICQDGACVAPTVDPCEPNPCDAPPADVCDSDGIILWTYPALGECTADGEAASCAYPPAQTNCAMLDAVCLDDACQTTAAPAAGDMAFTEVWPGGGEPTDAAWVELFVAAEAPLDLDGCVLDLGDGAGHTLAGLVALPETWVVFGNAAAAADVDVPVDYEIADLAIGGGALSLTCGGVTVDALATDLVASESGSGWSAQVDPLAASADANDVAYAWCPSAAPLGAGELSGTPGAPNSLCDDQVDWCGLQWPHEVETAPDAPFTVYLQVWEPGLTTLSAGPDAHPTVYGEVGWAPEGSDPTADAAAYSWSPLSLNGGFSDPSNDEYMADVAVPAAGEYVFVGRFTRDGGETWRTCWVVGQDGVQGAATITAP